MECLRCGNPTEEELREVKVSSPIRQAEAGTSIHVCIRCLYMNDEFRDFDSEPWSPKISAWKEAIWTLLAAAPLATIVLLSLYEIVRLCIAFWP